MNNQLQSHKSTPREILGRYKSVAVATVLLSFIPLIFHSSPYTVHTMIMMLFWAYMATAWNVMGGFLGHFAMGNGIYMAIGGYITGALLKYAGVTPWIGMIVAALITCVISCAVALPCFRLRGTYYSLSTVALLFIFRTIINNETVILGVDFGGPMGFRLNFDEGFINMQFLSKTPYYFIMLGLLMLSIILLITLNHSKIGYYFGAIKTNQEAAGAVGVNTTMYKLLAQFICTFLTAVGGGFYMMFLLYLDPLRVMEYSFSIEILLYAVVGGLGTVWGPAVGAFVLYPISELLRVSFGSDVASLSRALYALAFMLVVYFMPKGIFPAMVNLTKKYLKKPAAKKKEAK